MSAMDVTELDGRAAVDPESGSEIDYRVFRVQRRGHSAHRVEVEVTESGTPQDERCDCDGFRHRGHCSHITAVYAAEVLHLDWGD